MRRWLVGALAAGAMAADIVYVTDIQIFTLLAPCAKSALSYAIASETSKTSCAADQTALQKCACDANEIKKIASIVSTEIGSSCGLRATSDQQSASSVLDKYCNPSKTITFAAPSVTVDAYITDLPELSYLVPCARDVVSYAAGVQGAMSDLCPNDASLFAPCVCNSDRSKAVTSTISSSVRSSCSNDEDVTLAQVFFREYCDMTNGTTSFAAPPKPPGDMTYYITALPQYKSLDECAQTGISVAISAQTYSLCGTGPQALASCICLKSGMRGKVSSTLTESVKEYCSSTAISHVTSAVSVLDYYCSAAANKVVAKVDESISESMPASRVRTGSGSIPSETGSTTGAPGGSGSSGNSGSSGSGAKAGGTNKTAAIVGGVLGAVVLVAAIAGLYFFFRHRSRRNKATQVTEAIGQPGLPQEQKYAGVQELSTPSHTPHQELHGGPYNNVSELPPGQYPRQERAELPGSYLCPSQTPPSYHVSPQSPPAEGYGQPPSVSPSWSHDGQQGYGMAR